MNTIITSREAILSASRRLVMERGLTALNMRGVAAACGVAVGSVYHYFPSKDALLLATVEDVWRDIFHLHAQPSFSGFVPCVQWLYQQLREGCARYPGFFSLHSMALSAHARTEGRQRMEQAFDHMRAALLAVLARDPQVSPHAFSPDTLTQEDFVEQILTLVVSALLQGREDCRPVLELARRVLYPPN